MPCQLDKVFFIRGVKWLKLENHLLAILESLHDAVIVVSKDYTVIYVNKAYTEHFSVPKEKIEGKKLDEIEETSRILEVIRSGEPLLNDYSYVHSLGKHVCANMTPLIDNGEMIGVVTIMKDISEVTQLEKELDKYIEYSNELRKQLEQKNFFLLKSVVPKMKTAVSLSKKVAETTATILLNGESGVGKEVFARAIHEASKRHDKPFVAINIASIPDSLFESELFGHEEGAFTGSKKGGKKGLFEAAHGGTLFLDEIGEMSLNAQAKLLRVIQEREYLKVGGTKALPLDVRIICATHRNLNEEIKKGNFREDLFYRINVVPIEIPPLRERIADIPFLIDNILRDLSVKYMKHVAIDDDVIDVLKRYDWPGNVRELTNVIEQMIAVCTDSYFKVEDIPARIRERNRFNEKENFFENFEPTSRFNLDKGLQELLEKTEREAIMEVVKKSRTRSEAIKTLGISRKAFYAKLKKYNVL